MISLQVSIEVNGVETVAGYLKGAGTDSIRFVYDEDYRKGNHCPISLSLPFQEEPFSTKKTRIFFEGLLPEGFTRKSVAKWLHVDNQDYISILSGLGKECLGALKISDPNERVEDASYEPLSMEQVRKLANEGATKSTELVTKAHLSLTGASGKVGLYYHPKTGRWYLPKGDAPSTHILKQSHVRLQGIVANEQLTLLTAKNLGIEIPHSFIVNTGQAKDGDVLFATKRYDRRVQSEEAMAMPLRLHQEDFSQILGIPSLEKYERQGQHYLRQMFRTLGQYSVEPMQDQLKLWNIVIFNFLTGNTDAHVKNFSILYSPNLCSIRLAPAYDLVSTAIYDESTRQMAMNIGGEYDLSKIGRRHFERSAAELHLGKKIALSCFDRQCAHFEEALQRAAEELTAEGFDNIPAMQERILKMGGYANIQ